MVCRVCVAANLDHAWVFQGLAAQMDTTGLDRYQRCQMASFGTFGKSKLSVNTTEVGGKAEVKFITLYI